MAGFGDPVYFSRIYGSYLTNMPVGTSWRIDFVNLGDCKAPNGSFVNVPGQAVNNLYIRNDGSASVQYSVNGGDINDMIGGVISATVVRDPKFPNTNLKSVNFYVLPTGASLFASVDVEVQV